MVVSGLYLDHRVWDMDFAPSSFWDATKYGVDINLPKVKQTRIAKLKIKVSDKYKFALTTSVWEKPIRRTLQHLRNQGIKIFLLPREPMKFDAQKTSMFKHPDYLLNGEYFFKPDAVFAPGPAYAELWSGVAKTYVTGYPRFEAYIDEGMWPTKEDIANKYGLEPNRKWIFFPDYPPIFSQDIDGKSVNVDVSKARDDSLRALEKFAESSGKHQVVVKIHPQTWKSYTKYGMYVSDMLKSKIDSPTPNIKVVVDSWYESTKVAQELLIHSDIIVGYASTMLLEGAILNKSLVKILFGNTKYLNGLPMFDEYMPIAYDEQALHSILSNSIDNVNLDKLIKYYLHSVDGKSCERISKAILSEMNIEG